MYLCINWLFSLFVTDVHTIFTLSQMYRQFHCLLINFNWILFYKLLFLNSQEKKELDLKIKINHSIHPHPKCNQGIIEFLYVVYDNFISFN